MIDKEIGFISNTQQESTMPVVKHNVDPFDSTVILPCVNATNQVRAPPNHDTRSPLGDLTNQNGSPSNSRKRSQGTWKKKARTQFSSIDPSPVVTLEKRSCDEHQALLEDCGKQGKVTCIFQGEFISAEVVN